MQPTRRDMVAGLAASAILPTVMPTSAAAAVRDPLFARTQLAGNRVAALMERFDRRLPDIPVLTPDGTGRLSGVGGKTRLVSLWAVWCVPCLIEIRDFAALRPAVANARFDIGLLATASGKQFDRAAAAKKLATLNARGLPMLLEADGGARAAMELATPAGSKGFTLPCTLLVDATGRVRGRMFGAPEAAGAAKPATTPATSGAKKVDLSAGTPPLSAAEQAAVARGRTAWSDPDGRRFLRALGEGVLDSV